MTMKSESRNAVADKFAIAAALQEIGALLELKGGEYFKARAYKYGARALAEIAEDLGKLIKENRLTFVKGIGFALAKQIQELYTTGQSSFLNELRGKMPPGIIELSSVPGLSVKKVERLHQQLGVTTIEELKAACASGRVRNLEGFGAKSEQKILEAISAAQNRSDARSRRIHIHQALRTGQGILEYLSTVQGFHKAELAGSLRRWQETVSQIFVVASAKNPKLLLERFKQLPTLVRVEAETVDGCSGVLSEGFAVNLLAVKPGKFAGALLHSTGSKAHLDRLDELAARQKLKLSVRGLEKQVKGSTQRVPVKSEEDIYRKLGMQYVPPEMREDRGEIEAALQGALPEDLITTEEIRGMVHCHTKYSDGKHSVAEMVHAAESMGMKYITITDHSPTAFYANGVKIDRLQRQWEEIDRVQEQTRVRILKGTESDIVQSGLLDYPDWILEQFDVIVASIHSRYKMNADQMTRRIVTAMQQPVFKIWGHGLGRLIEKRPPFECRVEEILDVISESRAAIEINGDPYRLDLESRWVREARKRRIKFVISVDAHSTGALNNLKFGVGMARRGWVRRGEVLNALGVKAFQKAVRPI
jgi:DNA polymerase (family X)